MKRFLYTAILFFVAVQAAISQTEPMLAWLNSEFVKSINIKEPVVKVDAFGNVFAITVETYQNPFIGFLLVKYDSLGNKLWERKYEGGIWDHLWQGFTLDKDGNAYVSINYGGGLPGFLDDAIILKYSPSGDLIWELNYGTNFIPDNTVSLMVADSAGLLYLFGHTYDIEIPGNILFTACLQQSDGAEQWRTEYPGEFWPQAMRVFDDRLEIFATQYLIEGNHNFIQEYDLQGNILQTNAKPDPAYYQADFNHIMSDGSIVYGNRGFLYSATKVNVQGDTLWHYHLPNYNGSSKNWVRDIEEDDSLNVYVTGGWTQPGNALDMVTTKLSKDGELLWQHVFSNQSDSLNDTGDGIFVDEKYVYSIGGTQVDANNYNFIVFVLDRVTGDIAYEIELDNLANDSGRNIEAFQKGFVFIGSSSNGVSSTVLLTGYYELPSLIDAANEKIGYHEGQMKISPNPANEIIRVDFGEGIRNISQVQIVNISGQLKKSIEYQGQTELSLNVDELPSGAYFLKIGHVMKKFLIVR